MEDHRSRNDNRTVCCASDTCFETNSYLTEVDCAYVGGTMHRSGEVVVDNAVSHSEFVD